jgi:hypothetical protein
MTDKDIEDILKASKEHFSNRELADIINDDIEKRKIFGVPGDEKNPIQFAPGEYIRPGGLHDVSLRKPDSKVNPDAMFMCPNGHLQYNLTAEEIEDIRAHGEELIFPVIYEGSICRNGCGERVAKLTTDVKELQQRLGTNMMACAQLNGTINSYRAANDDNNKMALFLRNNYNWEIGEGQLQHSGSVSTAVIYYLKIERKRLRIRAGRVVRALLRMIGA